MLRPISELSGYTLVASDGEEVGTLDDFLFDEREWTIRWAVVSTGSWLTGRSVLLPPQVMTRPDPAERRLQVQLTRAQVERSPPVLSHLEMSRQMESELYDFYGWTPYWGMGGAFGEPMLAGLTPLAPPAGAGTGEPAGAEAATPADDPHLRSIGEVTGYAIEAVDGRLGHADDFLVEDESWTIRYLVADAGSWWHGRKVLVSKGWLSGVDWAERRLGVDLSVKELEAAPPYDPALPIGREEEERLHERVARTGYWSS